MLYTQVRAFDAVARAGSFLRAAELLNLSQPALSIQVRALEDTYGVKLFDREGRRVSLTAAGRQLYELTRSFMSLEEQIEGTLSAGKDLSRGRLNVAFDGPHATMPILARFRAMAPGIDVFVSMGNSRVVRQLLFERHVDVAVYPFAANDPRVHAVPIVYHAPVVIVGSQHPWRTRREVQAKELTGQPMITREAGSTTFSRVQEGLKELDVHPKAVLSFDSREAVIEAVAANLEIAIVWECEVRATGVHALLLRGSKISFDRLSHLLEKRHESSAGACILRRSQGGPGYEDTALACEGGAQGGGRLIVIKVTAAWSGCAECDSQPQAGLLHWRARPRPSTRQTSRP